MSTVKRKRSSVAARGDPLVGRLARVDCCAVSDALDKLGLAGVVSGLPQRSGEGRIAGRAVTVKLGTGTPQSGPPRHLGTTAIELAGPGDVIVVEQRSGVEAGAWGGILTVGAQMRGIAGVIVDGPLRDVDEARGYGYPIFSRSCTAHTARGRIVETGTNVPVTIGDITVLPGITFSPTGARWCSSGPRISSACSRRLKRLRRARRR